MAGRRLDLRHYARGRGGEALGLRRASQCPADEIFFLLREGLDRSAEVDADIRRITDIWENCQFRYGASGDFLFGFMCIADAM